MNWWVRKIESNIYLGQSRRPLLVRTIKISRKNSMFQSQEQQAPMLEEQEDVDLEQQIIKTNAQDLNIDFEFKEEENYRKTMKEEPPAVSSSRGSTSADSAAGRRINGISDRDRLASQVIKSKAVAEILEKFLTEKPAKRRRGGYGRGGWRPPYHAVGPYAGKRRVRRVHCNGHVQWLMKVRTKVGIRSWDKEQRICIAEELTYFVEPWSHPSDCRACKVEWFSPN